jgi:serine/threonine protein kinase
VGKSTDMSGDFGPTVAAVIDEACDRFEAAWRAGDRPRIEEALPKGHDSYLPELLRHLLMVELAYRRRGGEAPAFDEYRTRFPKHAQLIRTLFDETTRNAGARLSPTPALASGEPSAQGLARMGFEILGELGRGGMGVVYMAYDRRRHQRVALKTVRRADPASLLRFKREFRNLADVAHPNLVSLYDLISDGQCWFLTMELIDGVDFLSYVLSPVALKESQAILGFQTTDGRPVEDPCDHKEVDAGPNEPHSAANRDRTWCAAGVERAGLSPSQLARLRATLRQLTEGVAALHDAGKLHRDIKPTNVLVTRQGRVVLLDFGLAAELEPTDVHESSEPSVLGTVAYMSPEQAASRPVSPASDWYSVGAMLYEALTGRPPFLGQPLEVLMDKLRLEPFPPCQLVPDVPEDLNELCVNLLRRDPAARPNSRDVLRCLDRIPAGPEAAVPFPALPRKSLPLVGRQRHLAALAAAYVDMQRGRTVILSVHGHSGAGKSALVQGFLDELEGRDEAVILVGRCYERETVPYKALDGLIDALSRYLRRLPRADARELLPRDIGPLTRVFPVLRHAEAVAAALKRATEFRDPQELRRRAVAALRELLARLGDRRPLVLFIDDLQWGDFDSAAVLAEILKPPDPPTLLMLGCHRSEDTATSPFLRAYLESHESENAALDRRELSVDALTEWEARDLALMLLGQGDPTAVARAGVIARESRGSPLFVAELVRHNSAGVDEADRPSSEITLDEVLWNRIRRLPGGARRLLEAIAVSGRPLRQASAYRAAGLDGEGLASLALLRTNHLVRGTGTVEHVETYHDRIRETVIKHLPPELLRSWHLDLARELEVTEGTDAETLASHFQAAGEPAKAGRFYAEAAAGAAEALAFDRAANLYRLSLELRPTEGEEGRSMRVRHGDALANAGRGVEAARAYQEAVAGAPATEGIELQRRAAYQFLISGHIDEGLAAFNLLSARVGMRLSNTPRDALLRLLLYRAVLRVRGLRFRERDPSQIPSDELLRIDIARSVALGISLVDVIEGANWQTQSTLRALRGGEPLRIALAVSWEAVHSACEGPKARRRTARLLSAADRLAQRLGHPQALGMVSLSAGCVEFLAGRYPSALEQIDRAAAIFREQCTGVVWELDTAHIFGLWTLFCLGSLAELRSRFQLLSAEARTRGDRYVDATTGTRVESWILLAADAVGDARARADEAVRNWSRQRFHLQHMHRIFAHLENDLYAGDGMAAWHRLCQARPALDASLLLQIQHLRVDVLHFSGRCAVSAAAVAPDPRPLLRAADGFARRLERQRVPWASAMALLFRAGASSVRGDTNGAVAGLIAAAAAYDGVAMGLHAAAVRRQLGGLLGGDEGLALIAKADAWMTSQGVRNPARMAASTAPGFPTR